MPADARFTVTLTNEDNLPHNFTVRDGDDTIFVVGARGGASASEEVAAMRSGTYDFLCTIHPSMNGAFVVAAGSS